MRDGQYNLPSNPFLEGSPFSLVTLMGPLSHQIEPQNLTTLGLGSKPWKAQGPPSTDLEPLPPNLQTLMGSGLVYTTTMGIPWRAYHGGKGRTLKTGEAAKPRNHA